MSRLRKSITPILMAICICLISVCSFSIETHAVGDAVYLNYPEPATSDSQGYLVVGINNDGESQAVTFAWSLSSENLTQNTIEKLPFNINIGSNSISFSVTMDTSDNIWTNGYLSYYNYAGRYRILKSFSVAESNEMNFTYNFSDGVSVKSFYVKGAVGTVNVSSSYVSPPTVVFSGGVYGDDILTYLDYFNDYLMEIESNTFSSYDYLESAVLFLDNYLPKIDNKLEEINDNIDLYIPRIDNRLMDIEGYTQGIYSYIESLVLYVDNYFPKFDSYLASIKDYLGLQDFDDMNATDDYAEKSDSQSNSIEQATQDSSVEKVDSAAASGTIDDTLDFDAVNEYSNVLVVITNNSTVVTMLLIVMCVALISYVLFGKR